MKVVELTLFCLLVIAVAYEAKVYSICDFYYALKPLGLDPFKGIFAEQYLCAADQSSKLDTFYYENVDGIPRYGIFQLSGLEWCDNGRHSSQNKCHTSCDNFLDDNITDDALCVKTIVNSTRDMTAWPLYGKYCDERRVNLYYIKCLFGGAAQRKKPLLRNRPSMEGHMDSDGA